MHLLEELIFAMADGMIMFTGSNSTFCDICKVLISYLNEKHYYFSRLTDLGSVSSHQRAVAGMQHKLTSSNVTGGGPSYSIAHLAKAANSVTIGTVVHGSLDQENPTYVEEEAELTEE